MAAANCSYRVLGSFRHLLVTVRLQIVGQLIGQLLAANRRALVAFTTIIVATAVGTEAVAYYRIARIASFEPWAASGS